MARHNGLCTVRKEAMARNQATVSDFRAGEEPSGCWQPTRPMRLPTLMSRKTNRWRARHEPRGGSDNELETGGGSVSALPLPPPGANA
eukprot:CAMPEP_0180060180 /NCGR_PEP_ID=MMETSP0985-20121206/5929_1 /TAXON_ID=483367 /ORGANISM="non described non described, Strain CCMP 2436" /LENGTH=87 /DNA_ID=CAMNT_0021990235 /DNA_START=252 /DNA_END=511 /DNA_ORIENTATION=+